MDDDEQSLVGWLVGWLVRLLIGCTDEAHDWLDPSLIVADPIRLLMLSQRTAVLVRRLCVYVTNPQYSPGNLWVCHINT